MWKCTKNIWCKILCKELLSLYLSEHCLKHGAHLLSLYTASISHYIHYVLLIGSCKTKGNLIRQERKSVSLHYVMSYTFPVSVHYFCIPLHSLCPPHSFLKTTGNLIRQERKAVSLHYVMSYTFPVSVRCFCSPFHSLCPPHSFL